MKNKNIIQPFFTCSLLTLSFFVSTAYAELKLPSGADRRPNLSVDPFERAREAVRKLPKTKAPEPAPDPTPEVAQPEATQSIAVQPGLSTEPTEQTTLPPTVVSSGNAESGEAFSYELAITADALSVTAGGIPEPDQDDVEQSKTGIFGVADIIGEYDTGAAGLWNDGLFFVYAAIIFGKGPAVGDLHGTSNIYGGGDTFRIVEAWYEHSFPYSHSSIVLGIHDFNGEFYVSEYANLFMNGIFGMGQILNAGSDAGPSTYPVPTLGFRFKAELSEQAYFQVAAYNASPSDEAFDKIIEAKLPSNDEVFLITEFGMTNKEPGESGYYKAGLGLWYFNINTSGFLVSGDEEAGTATYILGDESKSGNAGVYVFAEMSIGEKLGIFFKHGRGRQEYNQYAQFYAAGLNYTGIIPGREEDVFGIGLVQTRHSSAYLDAFDGEFFAAETAFEITYTTNITDWLSVQPDFQYIQQPSMGRLAPNDGKPLLPNSMVIGVRASASF